MTDQATDAKLARLRELLPATGAGIYLATAERGPMPSETAAAMREADDWELRVGRATEGRDEDLAQRLDEARAVLAALVVGDPSEIALTTGIGQALSIAAWAPDWQPGDRAISVPFAGAPILAALEAVRSRFDLDLIFVEPFNITDAITRRTRLVMVPHVDPNTGRVVDVARLASSQAWIAVDASMSPGAISVNASELGADMVALAGDRWLLGPEATGAVWVGPRVMDSGHPAVSGAVAYETLQPSGARPWPDARRLEPGGLPRTAVLGLARSIGWLEMYVGLEWAFDRTAQSAQRLHQALSAHTGVEVLTPAEAMAAMLCFRLSAWPVEEALDELRRRVFAIIEPTPDRSAIRACVAWFNTDEEIDRFASAVAELARHTPRSLPRCPPLIVR